MKRVMKTRHFCRWMRKTELSDAVLCQAVAEMEAGLVDADLGGGVVKKRVALPGRGKSGSVRTLLATNKADRWFFVFGMLCGAAAGHAGWFFVFGFEKNERENITGHELEGLQKLASSLLHLSPEALESRLADGSLTEICHAQV